MSWHGHSLLAGANLVKNHVRRGRCLHHHGVRVHSCHRRGAVPLEVVYIGGRDRVGPSARYHSSQGERFLQHHGVSLFDVGRRVADKCGLAICNASRGTIGWKVLALGKRMGVAPVFLERAG